MDTSLKRVINERACAQPHANAGENLLDFSPFGIDTPKREESDATSQQRSLLVGVFVLILILILITVIFTDHRGARFFSRFFIAIINIWGMSERWTGSVTKMVLKLGPGELIFGSPCFKG